MAVERLALSWRTGPTSHSRLSKAWVPSEPSTPPPCERCEAQLNGLLGSARLLISQSKRTSQGSPSTPWLSSACSCWNTGTARYSKSTATLRPRSIASRLSSRTWATSRATGFSSSRCLPAFRAARASSKRGPGGVAITTASTAGSASSAAKSLWPGSSAARQAASRRSALGCQRATGSVPGQARRALRCTFSPKPRPATATWRG